MSIKIELAAGDQAAVRGELDRGAAVAAKLDDVARLEVGQLGESQVDTAQLDGQRDRHVERSRRRGCGWVAGRSLADSCEGLPG